MPEITRVERLDDMEYRAGAGEAIPADETVDITYKGVAYRTLLSKANATALDEALAPFLEFAERITASKGGARRPSAAPAAASTGSAKTSRTSRELTAEIREWAEGQNLEISERGRIPKKVTEAFFATFPEKRPAA